MKNTKRQTTPDAWLQLVLHTMSVEEIKSEINDIVNDAAASKLRVDELRWFRNELLKRGVR